MKIIKADVGWRVETDGKTYYVGEYDTQGVIYKDNTAYKTGKGVCYVPEYGFDNNEQNMGELFELDTKHMVADTIEDNPYYTTHGYTRQDFEDLVEGSPVNAEALYEMVDWQSPESLFYELEY